MYVLCVTTSLRDVTNYSWKWDLNACGEGPTLSWKIHLQGFLMCVLFRAILSFINDTESCEVFTLFIFCTKLYLCNFSLKIINFQNSLPTFSLTHWKFVKITECEEWSNLICFSHEFHTRHSNSSRSKSFLFFALVNKTHSKHNGLINCDFPRLSLLHATKLKPSHVVKRWNYARKLLIFSHHKFRPWNITCARPSLELIKNNNSKRLDCFHTGSSTTAKGKSDAGHGQQMTRHDGKREKKW